jgi:hypothetical protein
MAPLPTTTKRQGDSPADARSSSSWRALTGPAAAAAGAAQGRGPARRSWRHPGAAGAGARRAAAKLLRASALLQAVSMFSRLLGMRCCLRAKSAVVEIAVLKEVPFAGRKL